MKGRRYALFALAAALFAAMLVPVAQAEAATGAAAKKKKKARPAAALKLLTTSQRNIQRKRYVRVRVRGTRGRSVRVFARARRARGGKRAYKVTRSKLLRFKKSGRRTVKLKLTKPGRRIMRSCRRLRLSAHGTARKRRARRSRRVKASSRLVRFDTRACPTALGDEQLEQVNPGELANADRCDFTDDSNCLYPFPNDFYTRPDASTGSGRRVNLSQDSMPANRAGKRIEVSDYNRNDGFSPGNKIITKVPGLDNQAAFDRSGIVPMTDMERSFEPAQPVVVIDAATRQRQMIWAEVDANPKDPRDRTLIIRPGKNFREGGRYIVALRNLKNAEGRTIGAPAGFRVYRDKLRTSNKVVEGRRANFESIFGTLGQAGIGRKDLYSAWDFTVASEDNITGRALAIRDAAFAERGDTNLADLTVQGTTPQFIQNPPGVCSAPSVPVVNLSAQSGRCDFTPAQSSETARRITGRLVVPCYLDQPGCPSGSRYNLGPDGLPQRIPGNTTVANVICTIPRAALDGADPPEARPSLYGHGLLGSPGEVGAGNVQSMGQEHNFVFCATEWAGFSSQDVPNVATILQDLSRFPTLVDHSQQGFVNQLYLGRWMIHQDGLSANADFKDAAGESVVDRARLFYDGNSQGGILGGSLVALAPDFQRGVLGVPGMNYSTLLRRSVDFDLYANGEVGTDLPVGLYDNYPNELERPLILSLIQMLWDRGEANGYAHHMTSDPLRNTPPHDVLLHVGYGDHQVADVTTEVEARTIGASVKRPVIDPRRLIGGRKPFVGVPSVPGTGFGGSAVVWWDSGPPRNAPCPDNKAPCGTPAPPNANIPPREGKDPHSEPRSTPSARVQKSNFLRVGGFFDDVCGAGPCYSRSWPGLP